MILRGVREAAKAASGVGLQFSDQRQPLGDPQLWSATVDPRKLEHDNPLPRGSNVVPFWVLDSEP